METLGVNMLFPIFIGMTILLLAIIRPKALSAWKTDDKRFKFFCEAAMRAELTIDRERSDESVGVKRFIGQGVSAVMRKTAGTGEKETIEIEWQFEGGPGQWIFSLEDGEVASIETTRDFFRNPALTIQQKYLLNEVMKNIERSA